MKSTILYAVAILCLGTISCSGSQNNAEKQPVAAAASLNQKEMKSHISIFEIPATNVSQAANFYQAILDISIDIMEMPGMEMGIFPYEEQMVTGVIMKGEEYQPSANGVTIYLNGGDNLQPILDKVEKNGGKIITPKTAHADDSGFFALFLDTEGNKIGLHSPN